MRFFKYLIFIFLSIFSIPVFAAITYSAGGGNYGTSPKFVTKQAVCSWFTSKVGQEVVFTEYSFGGLGYCAIKSNGASVGQISEHITPDECFYPDYKIVSQPITSLKKTMCLPVNGAICKYTGDPTGSPIVNGKITTTFSSVSKTPDPTCKEELVNPPCDPNDPYGGCFTPPDDNCTRQFNGSIECPPDIQPPIEKGCNGATYCDRPPQGCGTGYVSGSFNGKALCVKTSPSNGSGSEGGGDGDGDGDGDGGTGSNTTDGTGTSTSTGTNTSTTTNSDGSSTTTNTTTNNTTVNNFKIDFSPVVNAVKQVSADIKNLKNELLTSITELTNKLGITNIKIDQTNSKLDATNTNLTSIKDSSLRQEDLLKAIRDKDSTTGASVDLTQTNGLLTEIRDGIDSIKDVFSDEGKAELEQIGQVSNDSRYLNAQGNAQSSLNNLANKLTFGSSSCLSDFQIQLPIFGSVNIALSQWCPLLALLKILLNLIVLLTCLRMLDATVRTI